MKIAVLGFVELISIAGELRYDVAVECLEKTVKPTNNINSVITISNTGHFHNTVALKYWLEGPGGSIIDSSSVLIELEPGESKNVVEKVFIPVNAINGTYYFNAELDYGENKKEKKSSFTVEGGVEQTTIKVREKTIIQDNAELLSKQHSKTISSLENKLAELNNVIENKRIQGINTKMLERKMVVIKRRIARARRMIETRDFEYLDKVIADRIKKEIDALIQLSNELG